MKCETFYAAYNSIITAKYHWIVQQTSKLQSIKISQFLLHRGQGSTTLIYNSIIINWDTSKYRLTRYISAIIQKWSITYVHFSITCVQLPQVAVHWLTNTGPRWSSMSSLPLKPFLLSICPNSSGGYSISLCLSCYALSPSAASLMLQGLRAGLKHNYALPHSLQLCGTRRVEGRGLYNRTNGRHH